ncbi:hypothetical protein RB595_005737 [Gaeumannomyces hyphopodioides]
MDDVFTFRYLAVALSGMWCLPFVVFFALSFFLARRKGDPARVAVVWIKVLLPFAVLYTVFITIAIATAIVLDRGEFSYRRGSSPSRREREYIAGLNRLSGFASYVLEGVTVALILFTFVELGNGFMYALSGERTARQRIFRYLSLIPALVLIALPLAYTIRYNIFYSWYREDPSATYEYYYQQMSALRRLSLAHSILTWIFTLPTVAYAAVVVHFWKAQPSVRGIAIQFLIATILMFSRATYQLIEAALNVPDRAHEFPEAAYYLSPIFSYPTLGVTVVLLFVIAIRKKKGLWSTQKQFRGGIEAGERPVQQHGDGQPVAWQPQQLQPVHQVKPPAY